MSQAAREPGPLLIDILGLVVGSDRPAQAFDDFSSGRVGGYPGLKRLEFFGRRSTGKVAIDGVEIVVVQQGAGFIVER